MEVGAVGGGGGNWGGGGGGGGCGWEMDMRAFFFL